MCPLQAESEPVLLQPEHMELHTAMWARSKHALSKSSAAASEDAHKRRHAAQTHLEPLQQQPAYVGGGRLHAHQLQTADWLRGMWAKGEHAVMADGNGLGKTASLVVYLQSLL